MASFLLVLMGLWYVNECFKADRRAQLQKLQKLQASARPFEPEDSDSPDGLDI